ncbi:18921_t:CDS:1, partial [Funneliformis geosporum]
MSDILKDSDEETISENYESSNDEEEIDTNDEIIDIDEENEELIDPPLPPLQEKLTKADVWNFVDKTTRKCPNCAKIFGNKTGTSSIRSHLKSHGLLLEKEKQTTLDNYVKRHSQEIQAKKTQAVMKWIILDMQAFKVVEGEAFNKIVSILDSQYQIP